MMELEGVVPTKQKNNKKIASEKDVPTRPVSTRTLIQIQYAQPKKHHKDKHKTTT